MLVCVTIRVILFTIFNAVYEYRVKKKRFDTLPHGGTLETSSLFRRPYIRLYLILQARVIVFGYGMLHSAERYIGKLYTYTTAR